MTNTEKNITFEHFTMELLLVNAIKAGGAFKKWRIFEDKGREFEHLQ